MNVKTLIYLLTFSLSFSYQIDKPTSGQQKIIDKIKKIGVVDDCFKNKKIGKWVYRCINELALHKNDPLICERQSSLGWVARCVGHIAKKINDKKLCHKAFGIFKNSRGTCETVFDGKQPFSW